MQASLQQKKGRGSRKNQKGKGHKAHGGGRWQGSSSGKPYRLCFASRGQARRKDTPANQSPQERSGEAQDTPKRVIGDKAYDSDPLRKRLKNAVSIFFRLIDATTGMLTDKMTDYGIATGDDIWSRELSAGSETFDESLSDTSIRSACTKPSYRSLVSLSS